MIIRSIMIVCMMCVAACSVAPQAPVAEGPPVFRGIDPAAIPMTEEIRIQIVPLARLIAVQVRRELLPLMGAEVQYVEASDLVAGGSGLNELVFKGPSNKIHRLVDILAAVEKGLAEKAVPVRWQMNHADATQAARMLNAKRLPAGTALVPYSPNSNWNGYTDVDVPENTVILFGTKEDVERAIKHLKMMDAEAEAS